MNPNYIYAHDPATEQITIQIETISNKGLFVAHVPSYERYEELKDRIEELERHNDQLNEEICSLESDMEEADQRYEEDQYCFWSNLALRVNSLGHDPLEIIAEELKKHGFYLEMRRAA